MALEQDHMVDRVGDRWDAMTPEERERFRQRMRERCGFDPSARESTGPDSAHGGGTPLGVG